MRNSLIVVAAALILIGSIRIFAAFGYGVPAFVEYYLLLIFMVALPVAGLLWLTARPSVATGEVRAVPGMLYRLMKGLVVAFAGLYGLGIALMLTG